VKLNVAFFGLVGVLVSAYAGLRAFGVASHPPSTVECIAAAIASFGSVLLIQFKLVNRPVALAVLCSTAFVLLGALWNVAWALAGRAPLTTVLPALALGALAITIARSLHIQLITQPYEPPGPGPLAPA